MTTLLFPASLLRRIPVMMFTIAAVLLCAAAVARAQSPEPDLNGVGGTHYIVAFPDTTGNALDSRYPNTRVRPEATLWIFSAVKNKVKISTNAGVSNTLTLEAGKFKVYQIPGSIVVDVSGSPVGKIIGVEADYPVVLYCYFAHIQSVEAWTPLPVDLWGTQYYAAAIPGEIVKEIGVAGETEVPETPKPGNAEILVIAAYDNTTVTLTPPPGVIFAGGAARTVTLNEGQVYQVQSTVDVKLVGRQQDLGETSIVSDKPIGVISGNTRAQVNTADEGLKNNAYKNMLMEWLHPVEQHGSEFVYLPTWDSHRPGIGAAAERKQEAVRIYNTVGKKITGGYGVFDSAGVLAMKPFSIRKDTLAEIVLTPNRAIYVKTDNPAQAMMHSSAIVQFNGSTPCFRGIPCLSYSAWAPYMVELTPREQWASFAPYYAPTNPGGMQHYINVVTDTNSVLKIIRENGSTFLFNRKIPGTDLIWGSMSVSQGEDHWLMGKDGAKFSGFVYGVYQGGEEYRPGRTRKKDDAPSPASGGDVDAPAPLHPCEYEEYNAVSYGYPLVPMGRVLKPADSLQIDTTMDCSTLTIKIRALNANPVGLRSLTFDPASVKNAKLTPVDPQRLSDILGRTRIELKVEPIDPLKNAEGTVTVVDRTGKVWKIYYKYEAEYVLTNPTPNMNFGVVVKGATVTRTMTITNPLARPLVVKSMTLARGTAGFTIDGTTPDGPAKRPTPQAVTLAPGQVMTVTLRLDAAADTGRYRDTLLVAFGCTSLVFPLSAETATPIINVGDLNFGTFLLGTDGPKTLALQICNIGTGELTFNKPGDPDPAHLVEWLDSMGFTADLLEIAKLKDTALGSNGCYTIHVTFTPTKEGTFVVVARFWGSTRRMRDTSVWRGVVTRGPASAGGGVDAAGNSLRASTIGSSAMIRYRIAEPGATRVEIYNSAGELMDRLVDGREEPGEHRAVWDAAGRAAGIYYCVIESGGWRRSVPIVIVR